MTNKMMAFQDLLRKMRHAQPSRALDREVHKIVGGRFGLLAPRYTSNWDAAYALLLKSEVTMLELNGSWEPNDAAVHPAWAVRYYTKERPPEADSKGGWYGCVSGGTTPAIALCRAAIVVLARVKHGTWISSSD